jgi:hypothetical protein
MKLTNHIRTPCLALVLSVGLFDPSMAAADTTTCRTIQQCQQYEYFNLRDKVYNAYKELDSNLLAIMQKSDLGNNSVSIKWVQSAALISERHNEFLLHIKELPYVTDQIQSLSIQLGVLQGTNDGLVKIYNTSMRK